jgi:uncharacterized protein YjbJ (UPF0337 family)
MNWNQVEGNWKMLKGRVQEKWGKLTDDKLDQIEGRREHFVGLIQREYGITREEAEYEADGFIKTL